MLAITNGKIHTCAGDVIDRGTVLIENGKIKAIGKDIDIPKEAKLIDAEGHMVTPGLVDAHTHIGIGEEGIGFEGRDYNEMTNPVTPSMRGIDGIYPDDEGFVRARSGGITTAVTGPGSANAIGGTFVAIKTVGRRIEDMIIKDPVAMKVAFGENIKRVYNSKNQEPMTRMGIASLIRKTLYKAQAYMEKKENLKEGEVFEIDLDMEALIPVLKKEIPLKAHAHRTDDIFTSIRIAKEFDVRLTLDHCTEGHLIADILGEEGYDAIVGPSLSSASKYELRNKSYITARTLYENGLKVAIITDAPVIPLEHLSLCAGLAVRSGLPEEEALKAITINAAEITGIDDRVGSLEVGKDGDLVIWSDNPLRDVYTLPLYTIINGEIVFRS